MAGLGTMEWMDKTGGKIAWHDRLSMLFQGVQAKAAAKRRLQGGLKIRNLEVQDVIPPDSAVAKEATMLSAQASKPYLFNHCMRSYFWAKLMDDGKQKYDDEALYVAIMLHDLGLTDAYRLEGQDEHCFTIVGAREAEVLALRHNWSEKRAELVANAISLHINIEVGDKFGREAQLVRAGSGGDVGGLGMEVLHLDQIAEVIEKYPRINFKENIIEALEIEVCERPFCRFAYMYNTLKFGRVIRQAAMFDE